VAVEVKVAAPAVTRTLTSKLLDVAAVSPEAVAVRVMPSAVELTLQPLNVATPPDAVTVLAVHEMAGFPAVAAKVVDADDEVTTLPN